MSLSFVKEKEVMLSIIDLYKGMPYLWNKGHKDYFKKRVRKVGYKVLLEVYKIYDVNASLNKLKKKLDNMRSNYFKELKKMKASKLADSEAEEMYVSTLWYFKAFSFFDPESCQDPDESDPTESGNSTPDVKPVLLAKACLNSQPKRRKIDTTLESQDHNYSYAENVLNQTNEQWEVYGR